MKDKCCWVMVAQVGAARSFTMASRTAGVRKQVSVGCTVMVKVRKIRALLLAIAVQV